MRRGRGHLSLRAARGARGVLAVGLLGVLALVAAPTTAVAVVPGDPADATVFVLSAPATTVAGTPVDVTVTAHTARGEIATSYLGSVQLSTDDPRSPVVPPAYLFTSADAGVHTFAGLNLHAAGTWTVTATEMYYSLTGTTTVRVFSGPAVRLETTEHTLLVQAGGTVTVPVAVKDAWSNLATSYRGTVTLAAGDPRAVVAAPWTFTAADRGRHDLAVTLYGAGHWVVSVSDPTLAGDRVGVTVMPGPAATLEVQAPATATTGVRFPLTLAVHDSWGNLASSYRGTLALSSTDGGAGGWFTPAQYTFTAADAGRVVLTGLQGAVLATPGARTITVRDVTDPALAAAATVAVRLPTGHALYAWGENAWGQLGTGTTTPSLSPVRVGTERTWVRVSANDLHTAAIKADGTLWAWGNNSDGQLGDGTRTPRSTPVRIGTTNQWAWVSVGWRYTLALKRDGTLWGWGRNWSGQLGNGTTTSRLSPVRIGTDNHWVALSTADSYSHGLKSDGTLWSWGRSFVGGLGDGSTQHLSPVRIGTDSRWVSVSAGGLHSVAIRSDSTLWAWGDNDYGMLGDGTTTAQLRPLQVGAGRPWAVARAGGAFTLAMSGSTVFAWGKNDRGQLGDGTTTNRLLPTYLPRNTWWRATTVEAGEEQGFVVTTGGALVGWGGNLSGEVGLGTTGPVLTPTRIGTATTWSDVSTGFRHTMGLRD
ncbi:hypothetical protein [Cellulomonas sp.]|uniref:RCC1 domain-containing protein n=1 Tax=Cellulomonas sp. TaxID=40001 RepID=UPI003BA8B80A